MDDGDPQEVRRGVRRLQNDRAEHCRDDAGPQVSDSHSHSHHDDDDDETIIYTRSIIHWIYIYI